MGQGVAYEQAAAASRVELEALDYRVRFAARRRVQRIRQQLAVDQHLAVPRQHDRALGGQRVEVGVVRSGLKRDRGPHFGGAGVDHRRDRQPHRVAGVAGLVDDRARAVRAPRPAPR